MARRPSASSVDPPGAGRRASAQGSGWIAAPAALGQPPEVAEAVTFASHQARYGTGRLIRMS